jgi:hypothetical protein
MPQNRLLDTLEQASTLRQCRQMRDGQLAFLLRQPSYDRLRGHPGYEQLLAEMSFPSREATANS